MAQSDEDKRRSSWVPCTMDYCVRYSWDAGGARYMFAKTFHSTVRLTCRVKKTCIKRCTSGASGKFVNVPFCGTHVVFF